MLAADLTALLRESEGLLAGRDAQGAARLLAEALEEATDDLQRATLLAHVAAAEAYAGAYAQAEAAADEAHELAASRGARAILGAALRSRAVLRMLEADWVGAVDDWRLLGHAVQGDAAARYDALVGEALAWVGEGEPDQAEARLQDLPRRPMGASMEGRVLLVRAALAARRGELHAATQGWVAGVEALEGTVDWLLAVPGLAGVAAGLETSGDPALPLAAAERAAALARESDNDRLLGDALLLLADYYEAAGHLPVADDCVAEALRCFERVRDLPRAAAAHRRSLELAAAMEVPALLVSRGATLARVERDLGHTAEYERGVGEALVLATRFEADERPALAAEVADVLARGGPTGATVTDVIALAVHVAMAGFVERTRDILAARAAAAAEARRDEAAARLFAATAELSHELGDVAQAAAHLQRAIRLAERLGLVDATVWAERLASLG